MIFSKVQLTYPHVQGISTTLTIVQLWWKLKYSHIIMKSFDVTALHYFNFILEFLEFCATKSAVAAGLSRPTIIPSTPPLLSRQATQPPPPPAGFNRRPLQLQWRLRLRRRRPHRRRRLPPRPCRTTRCTRPTSRPTPRHCRRRRKANRKVRLIILVRLVWMIIIIVW